MNVNTGTINEFEPTPTSQRAMKAINSLMLKDAYNRSRLMGIKAQLVRIGSEIEDSVHIEYTSWVVMLKKNEDGSWTALTCLDLNNLTSDDETDFDIIMPIPDPETIPDFQGF